MRSEHTGRDAQDEATRLQSNRLDRVTAAPNPQRWSLVLAIQSIIENTEPATYA